MMCSCSPKQLIITIFTTNLVVFDVPVEPGTKATTPGTKPMDKARPKRRERVSGWCQGVGKDGTKHSIQRQ